MSKRASAISAPSTGPILLVLASALLWGLWWVPVRLCEALGLTGVWPNLGINVGALLGLGAIMIVGRSPSKLLPSAILGCTLVGIAVALYGAALSLTDVARAVLLFYLAPAWSTLIEVTFLNVRWHWRRLPPLVLSFAGLLVVFRGNIALDHGGLGDLAALASGIAWSAGTALVFSTNHAGSDQGRTLVSSLAFTVMVAAVATSIILLPLDWQGWPVLERGGAGLAVLLALGAGVVYLAPIIGVTLWGAKRLMPSTISFLLAAEILSGITSSALFLDEPFGWWELTGTIMIIASVVTHVTFSSTEKGES